MKQKYTITIADVQMNIITDEEKSAVDAIVGVLDRRMREICLQSGSRCPKTEAALLCALDYCAERTKLQEELAKAEAEKLAANTEGLMNELETLKAENDRLKSELSLAEDEAKAAKSENDIANDRVKILMQKANESERAIEGLKTHVSELEVNLKCAQSDTVMLRTERDKALRDAEEARKQALVAEASAEAVRAEIKKESQSEAIPKEPVPAVKTEEKPSAPVTELKMEIPEEPVKEEPMKEESVKEEPVKEEPVKEESPVSALANESAARSEAPEMKPVREEKVNLNDTDTMEKEKHKAQKRVRSMFDLITFDNI